MKKLLIAAAVLAASLSPAAAQNDPGWQKYWIDLNGPKAAIQIQCAKRLYGYANAVNTSATQYGRRSDGSIFCTGPAPTTLVAPLN
jgi:hypothetical protein